MKAAPRRIADAPDPKCRQARRDRQEAQIRQLRRVRHRRRQHHAGAQGVDPEDQEIHRRRAALKKQIAALQANKKIPAEDKKAEIAELNDELKSIVPVKFKATSIWC